MIEVNIYLLNFHIQTKHSRTKLNTKTQCTFVKFNNSYGDGSKNKPMHYVIETLIFLFSPFGFIRICNFYWIYFQSIANRISSITIPTWYKFFIQCHRALLLSDLKFILNINWPIFPELDAFVMLLFGNQKILFICLKINLFYLPINFLIKWMSVESIKFTYTQINHVRFPFRMKLTLKPQKISSIFFFALHTLCGQCSGSMIRRQIIFFVVIYVCLHRLFYIFKLNKINSGNGQKINCPIWANSCYITEKQRFPQRNMGTY